jgi:hypothetical protein
MHLVVIFGPPAVGKMSVGHELAEATGLRLFHNHMALEPVLRLFAFDSPQFTRIVRAFRDHVFQEVADSDLPGLIYTCMWDLDDADDRAYIDDVCFRFEARGAAIHFVELWASLDERLRRNRTAQRLEEKPSKRDVHASEQRLLAREMDGRLNSNGDFFYPERHIRIDNTHRSARDTAATIAARLGLPRPEHCNPSADAG